MCSGDGQYPIEPWSSLEKVTFWSILTRQHRRGCLLSPHAHRCRGPSSPPPPTNACPAHPKGASAHACVLRESAARQTRLAFCPHLPGPQNTAEPRVGRGPRKKSIFSIFWISRFSVRASRVGHCGHSKTNPSVRFNTGGSPQSFFPIPAGSCESQSPFASRLAALASKLPR